MAAELVHSKGVLLGSLLALSLDLDRNAAESLLYMKVLCVIEHSSTLTTINCLLPRWCRRSRSEPCSSAPRKGA